MNNIQPGMLVCIQSLVETKPTVPVYCIHNGKRAHIPFSGSFSALRYLMKEISNGTVCLVLKVDDVGAYVLCEDQVYEIPRKRWLKPL
jgi:hypothetical protein